MSARATGMRASMGCFIAGMVTLALIGAASWLLRFALDERTERVRRGTIGFLLASIDPVIEALPTPGDALLLKLSSRDRAP